MVVPPLRDKAYYTILKRDIVLFIHVSTKEAEGGDRRTPPTASPFSFQSRDIRRSK